MATNSDVRAGGRIRAVERAQVWLDGAERAFQSDDGVIEAGRILFGVGAAAEESEDRPELQRAEALLESLRARLHAGILSASPEAVRFSRASVEAELGPVDVEILLVLALAALGLLPDAARVRDLDDLQRQLRPCAVDPLLVARALAPGAPLVRSGLVRMTESELPVDVGVALAPEFVQGLWREGPIEPWEFHSEANAHDRLRRLALAARRHVTKAGEDESLDDECAASGGLPFNLEVLYSGFRSGLDGHPEWALARTLAPLTDSDCMVLLLLVARDLGHVSPSDAVFQGAGLAACVSNGPVAFRNALAQLRRDGALRVQGLIRPCGGLPPGIQVEDEAILREAEFELSGQARKALGIRRQWQSRSGNLRKAVVRLDQLVLHDEVDNAIREAIGYARRPERLLDDWGLRKVMPYGHGTTLLFTGPPGVGKTAAAEGIAHELGKQLLTIDYSAIQSSWVGATEKQVVAAFREAADEDAVLFWDEADAMFFDRESASRNWEVREVNVLLKEIETFAGVCILATNRDMVLDPALDRRISRRLHFAPPSAEMGAKIWRLMIPDEMPISGEPDFMELGRLGLTGGQIKNAVMEAARHAITMGEGAAVQYQDMLGIARRRAVPTDQMTIGFRS